LQTLAALLHEISMLFDIAERKTISNLNFVEATYLTHFVSLIAGKQYVKDFCHLLKPSSSVGCSSPYTMYWRIQISTTTTTSLQGV
jgi:hypothetical protein